MNRCLARLLIGITVCLFFDHVVTAATFYVVYVFSSATIRHLKGSIS